MQLFSTESQNKESVPDDVGLYVCGITPYDTTHLGHAFTFVQFDVLVRFLRSQNGNVQYVQNITDVDDDLLKKARELNMNYKELAFRETQRFLQDMASLHALPPDKYVQATDHIPEMIQLISELLEKGAAYRAGCNVYFDVSKYKAFGSISHVKKGDWLAIANDRGNKPDDPHKKNPIDFVLWQESTDDEPFWDAPFGKGRPGWHTECIAMSTKYLGKPFTIHGGGADLAFPHHEAESAQANGNLSRIWMHTGMVSYQSQKMSKSQGNLVLVNKLLEKYSANVIRLMLLKHQYREPWEFSMDELDVMQQFDKKLVQAWRKESAGPVLDVEKQRQAFLTALSDDLDTPLAIKSMAELVELMLSQKHTLGDAKVLLGEMSEVLGLQMTYATTLIEELDLKNKTLMVIGAHPDDNDFMAAGTVARTIREGGRVIYVIATRGNRGSNDETLTQDDLAEMRKKEQSEAGKILGFNKIEFLAHPDGELVSNITLKEQLVRLIRMHKPDIIITMNPTFVYDTERNMINHTDHRAIGEATMDAVYPLARDKLSFPEHAEDGLEPHIVAELCFSSFNPGNMNTFVDISDVMDQKLHALQAHKSQLPDTEDFRSMVKDWSSRIGNISGRKYAEGFTRLQLRGHWE